MLAKGLTWNTRYAGTTGAADEFGYMVFRLNYGGKTYHLKAHAIAYALMTGSADVPEIDHRNVSESDNRIGNLRPATRSQNNANRLGWSKSGLPKGVHFRHGKFIASGTFRGRTTQIGTFGTAAEAHLAYCAWARPLHGEFFNAGPEKSSVFD